MRGERGGQLLPLAHEPRHLLLRTLALGSGFADALAVRVEGRVTEPRAELRESSLERVNLSLDLLQPPPQLTHVLRRLPGALGRFSLRRPRCLFWARRSRGSGE